MKSPLRLDIYRRMLTIRKVEEAVADNYSKQQMRCPIHLSIGQEAVPAVLSAMMTHQDRVYSSHRCHAHYLAKGGNIEKMIAELHGKATGCAKGKGGSMHLVDASVGMMGSSALVAGSIPLAVGSALAIQRAGKKDLSVAYFGDGGSEEGIFYECLNFAALKKLPVIFACENNLYATYSHQSARQSVTDISKRGAGFGVPSERVDGYDLKAVIDSCTTAVERARSGQGPTLLEFMTCRWRDHVGPDHDYAVGYRTEKEVAEWMDRCPLKLLEAELLKSGELTSADKLQTENLIKTEIETAFHRASQSPQPFTPETFDDIYA